jgi:hypothetical protein
MSEEKMVRPVFSNKPFPLPIEMRPLWRISLIVLAVSVVGKEKGYLSFKKVSILVWMLIRHKRWQEYREFLVSRSSDIPFISADKSTYRAIELAAAKDMLRIEGGKLWILKGGLELHALLNENGLMSDEIEFLSSFGGKLTDSKVKRIMGGLI